jgi:DNA-binding PadR family transcriptional regulator
MARSSMSNPLARAVLSCLLEKPMHPYEISTTLRYRGKENSIKLNYGSLYAVVESLSKNGMIAASETVRDGRRPERTVYEITPAGREKHDSWLAELISSPVRDFTSLEAGLSLMAALPPAEIARLLDMRAEKLQISLRGLKATFEVATERGLPELFLVEDYFRQAMTQAELDFVRTLADDIRSGSLGGVKVWQRMHELIERGVSLEEIGKDPVHHLGEEARSMQPPS